MHFNLCPTNTTESISFPSPGGEADIYQNDFIGKEKHLRYSSKQKGFRKSEGKAANMAAVVAQLARIRAGEMGNQCGLLEDMVKAYRGNNQAMLDKVAQLLDTITTNFEGRKFDAAAEADIVSRVLRIATGIVEAFAGDKEMQALALKMVKKEIWGRKGNNWEGGEGSGHWGGPGGQEGGGNYPGEGTGSWGTSPSWTESWGTSPTWGDTWGTSPSPSWTDTWGTSPSWGDTTWGWSPTPSPSGWETTPGPWDQGET